MKKFTKGTLTTIVEDDDRRIADYSAFGWHEEDVKPIPPTTAADKTLAKAISDVNDSEINKTKRCGTSNKKVNAAIKANNVAVLDGEAVDDGLISKEKK